MIVSYPIVICGIIFAAFFGLMYLALGSLKEQLYKEKRVSYREQLREMTGRPPTEAKIREQFERNYVWAKRWMMFFVIVGLAMIYTGVSWQ